MADKTGIEWTDATWSVTYGCSLASPGCTHCYAMRMASRLERMGRAADAARAMRRWLADPATGGDRACAHIDLARPRRGVWIETCDCQTGAYTHALLPGWEYTTAEMRTEMIEDLERLAATGELPKEATRLPAPEWLLLQWM